MVMEISENAEAEDEGNLIMLMRVMMTYFQVQFLAPTNCKHIVHEVLVQLMGMQQEDADDVDFEIGDDDGDE